MQVKVFEAYDMASGLKKVKDTFGPDALILSTKTIRKGKLGLMGKPTLEITAAIDNGWEEKKSEIPSRDAGKPRLQAVEEPELTYEKIWSEPEEPPAAPQKLASTESTQLKDEIEQLKSTINNLTSKVSSIQTETRQNQTLLRPYVEPEFSNSAPGQRDSLVDTITGYGINTAAAAAIAHDIRDAAAGPEADIDLKSGLKAAVTRMVTTKKLLHKKLTSQKRLSLIGPTGVGKTTTIAKLAANYLNAFGGKIALITVDTYRIAAVEQLKVYGEIMRLPVEVVLKPRELKSAFEKFADYDLILIDTAGRSPKNKEDLAEMASFLKPEHSIENHLLLSATTRDRELEATIESFSILPVSSLIFSKIDECDRLGIIVNIQNTNQIPISYLTNGQRVPEDILAPNPAVIADYIINDHRTLKNG